MCPFKKAFPCAVLLHLIFVAGIFSAWAGHKPDATFTLAPAIGDGEAMTLSVVRVGVARADQPASRVEGLDPATSEASPEHAQAPMKSDMGIPLAQSAPTSGVAGTPGDDERAGGAAAGNAGGEMTPPVVIARPKPSRVEGVASGSVEVFFTIDETGRVQNPRIGESSSPYLSAAVLKILPQWRFVSAKQNGEPIALKVRQVVEF